MKTLISFLILFFCLCACIKDPFLIPTSEIPQWLQDRITHDEKIIQSDQQSGLDITAWIRYKYKNSYYFEYHNMIWSSGPEYYDFDGNKILLINEPYLEYNTQKCCKKFVWKGPNYIGD